MPRQHLYQIKWPQNGNAPADDSETVFRFQEALSKNPGRTY